MTSPSVAFAEKLEYLADRVRKIRSIDHRNPHAFVEDKSDVVGEMLSEAKRLRTMATPRALIRRVGDISTGVRTIGRREIRVETRRRA